MARFDPSTMQAGNNLTKALDAISKRRFDQEKQDAEIAESKQRAGVAERTVSMQEKQLQFNIDAHNAAEKKRIDNEVLLNDVYKETQGNDSDFKRARAQITKDVNKGGFKEGFYAWDDDTQRDNILTLASLVSRIGMEQSTIRGLDGLKAYLIETGLIDKMKQYGKDVDSNDQETLANAIAGMESTLISRSQKLDHAVKRIEFSALKGIKVPGINPE